MTLESVPVNVNSFLFSMSLPKVRTLMFAHFNVTWGTKLFAPLKPKWETSSF